MLRRVGKPCLPDDLPGRRQRRGSLSAEVDVDAIALDDRCRRGVTVLGVGEIGAAQVEDLDVDDLASAFDVEGQRAQRRAFFLD
jgi:hypothetical protein